MNETAVGRESRERQNGHRSVILWFTGLPGAGKTTLAYAVEERLHKMGCRAYVVDGDVMRSGLCRDLDFSIEARNKNIRRVGEVAKMLVDAGVIAITAFISPLRNQRRSIIFTTVRTKLNITSDMFMNVINKWCISPPNGLLKRKAQPIDNRTDDDYNQCKLKVIHLSPPNGLLGTALSLT